jgi:exonuclease SbcC
MQVTKLIFKNFMGYKQLELPKANEELPEGLILISGQNSYGKSTILEGVLFTFFGPKIFIGRNAASFITYGESKAEVTIYFTLDNKKYNIFRKWGRTGGTTTKLFEWVKTSYREVKNFNIENFFEISTDQALNTVFVRQGEVEELANKKGAELREMIIDLFRLNIIDDALSHLDSDSKKLKYEKTKLEKKRVPVERIEEDINRITLEINGLNEIINLDEKKKAENESRLSELPSSESIKILERLLNQQKIDEEKYNSYQKDLQTKIKKTSLSIGDFEPIDNIVNQIKTQKKEQIELISNRDLVDKQRVATSKGLGITRGRIQDAESKIEKMRKSLDFKDGTNTALCPTCQNELTKEHYDEMILKFNDEIKVNKNKIKSISKRLDTLGAEFNQQQKKIDGINVHIQEIQVLKQDYENFQKYEAELKKTKEALNSFLSNNKEKFPEPSSEKIKKLSIEKETLTAELNAIEKDLKEKYKRIKKNKDEKAKLIDEITRMTKLDKTIGELEIEIDHINKAKEFVRRFVTEYMVVKRLVKNIALTTNKYIKDFTSGQYSDLLLDLSGTRKTGLSLKIKDNFNGVHESIEVLSGGDKTALGMALRLAISELMSKIRPIKESPKKNPKIDILLLDEPLAALDATRRERILKHLIKSKTFSQIFLITHTEIPSDINTHKIHVSKDHSTGISTANFKRETKLKSSMLNP